MKIALLVRDLSQGGIQASAIKLAENIPEVHFVVSLEPKIELQLPSKVKHFCLLEGGVSGGRLGRLSSYLRAVWRLARLYKNNEFDVIMSMGFSMNVLAALAAAITFKKPKLVCGIRNSIYELKIQSSRFSFMRLMAPIANLMADGVIVNSQGLRSEIEKFWMPMRKVFVVNNGYDFESISVSSEKEPANFPAIDRDHPVVVFVGRLSRQKNLLFLLHAFSNVLERIKCTLVIVGDGPERDALEKYVKEKEIEEYVFFAGKQENPYPYMRRSTCLVLTSDYEGFPNVLVESMACGTPVVSVDCPHGPKEILSRGGGVLVEGLNEVVLANAIYQLLTDKELREKLALEAIDRSAEYTIEKMINNMRNAVLSVV